MTRTSPFKWKSAALLLAACLALSGCGMLKKVTGQRNDTVLPGQREDILSPDQTKAPKPETANPDPSVEPGQNPDIPCDPTQQDCSSVDQEGNG